MKKITEIADTLELTDIELYGNYKAKINNNKSQKKGKLILITSVNPTPYGEGKTTLTIGLNDSLNKLNKKSVAILREPSLGPVFGSKGGATGGGKAIVVPEEDINLHFTGDFHTITSANNLLCAIIDNHIYQGNELNIDKVVFKRCIDMNDRELRNVKLKNRNESFVITPASEIMAILCLAKDTNDLKVRLGNIIIGYTKEKKEIFARDLNCVNALYILLKEAFKPNLVQSLYENPVIIHGGPFANIAHGCNSLVATNLGLDIADYVITEAGFGSDMGAIKFFDIKCRDNNIYPDVVVINVTIQSIKYNNGLANLEYHINNMKKFNSNVIVSLNKFESDLVEEIKQVEHFCSKLNVPFVVSTMYKDGEDGCLDLTNIILNLNENKIKNEIYSLNDTLENKIKKLLKYFDCNKVNYDSNILEKIKFYDKYKLPICLAKTPYSITDDSKKLGYPKNNEMTITDISISNGAGFIIIYMGSVMMLPGLGKNPNYLKIKI